MATREGFSAGQLWLAVVAMGLYCGVCVLLPVVGMCVSGLFILAAPILALLCAGKAVLRKGDAWASARQTGIALVLGVLGIVSLNVGIEREIQLGKEKCVPLIAALEAYHAREGQYPVQLASLVPRDLPSLPEPFATGGFGKVGSLYAHDGEVGLSPANYRLIFHPALIFIVSYSSRTKSWSTRD